MFQVVTIELSDGRTGSFSGPALVAAGDEALSATDIQFGLPAPLPMGFVAADPSDVSCAAQEAHMIAEEAKALNKTEVLVSRVLLERLAVLRPPAFDASYEDSLPDESDPSAVG